MILNETFTLSNGIKIPKVGLGTWLVKDEDVEHPVAEALKMGYRHIDSAQGYGNERGVGEAIRQSGIAREEIFVTTKLRAEIKNYDEAVAAIEESLKKLDLEYIDLMLIHAPKPWDKMGGEDRYLEGNVAAWRAMEEAYKSKKIRTIGVSNFDKTDIENIINNCEVKPEVNQILAYVGKTPFDTIDYCKSKGILVEAYSPIAHGKLLEDPELIEIAKKYEVSVAQLALRYCIQIDTLPLPKSVTPKNIKNNSELNFVISDEDMATLKKIDRPVF